MQEGSIMMQDFMAAGGVVQTSQEGSSKLKLCRRVTVGRSDKCCLLRRLVARARFRVTQVRLWQVFFCLIMIRFLDIAIK
jgi:hypothetical protein